MTTINNYKTSKNYTVKTRLAIEKVTFSPDWHLNAPFSSVTLECVAVV
jgi:hypothetical protein